jgi:competence protein ComEC
MNNNKKPLCRTKIFIVLFTVITTVLFLFIIFSPKFVDIRKTFFRIKKNKNAILKVAYLYVGQGNAALVRDLRPGGKNMLIDGGIFEEFEKKSGDKIEKFYFNSGEKYILPYLRKEGIEKIDYILATHKDVDHIGGLPYIVKNVEVKRLYYNSKKKKTNDIFKELIREAQRDKALIRTVKAGKRIPFGDGIECQVIAPLRKYKDAQPEENNSSVVVRFVVGDISFMFPGDIEIPAELDILSYGESMKTTVLCVPHHGSHSSSSRPFVDKVRPEVAIFSCGRYNKYGFPVFEIVRRYEEAGAKIYRTDLHGNIEIETDGRNYVIKKSM